MIRSTCATLAFTLTAALALYSAAGSGQPAQTPPAASPPASEPAPMATPDAAPSPSDAGAPAEAAPAAPGTATIVFMRPSILGGPVASSLFEIVDGKATLIGILRSKQRLTFGASPGAHLFMVVGESADFMSADVSAGKTYYTIVAPRMGMWKARFSLRPVHVAEMDTKQFEDWKYACALVERNSRDDAWAVTNAAGIEDKRAKYFAEWQQKPEAERPALVAADGR